MGSKKKKNDKKKQTKLKKQINSNSNSEVIDGVQIVHKFRIAVEICIYW